MPTKITQLPAASSIATTDIIPCVISPAAAPVTKYVTVATLAAALTPTGTGFTHVTGGVQDAAAKLVADADVSGSAAIAVSKLAAGTNTNVLTTTGGVPVWAAPALPSDLNIASEAQGDILYFNGSNWVRLAAGTSGWFLKTQGPGANPVWAAGGGGGSPGGASGQVQVNNGSGGFYADAHLTYSTGGTGALAVAADGTGYLSIGSGTLPAAGQIRVPNNTVIIQSVTAGGAPMPVLKTDSSNEVYLGDTAGGNAYVQITGYNSVSLNGWNHSAVAVWGGTGGFNGKSAWKQSQLAAVDEPSGDASNGQWWFDPSSRPKCIDGQSNKMQMGTICVTLAADAQTTNVTATATNLTFTMGASDEWAFRIAGLSSSSGGTGVHVAISGPASCTLTAQVTGNTSVYDTLTAAGTLNADPLNTFTGTGVFAIEGRIKGDGVHGGAVTLEFATHTSGTATIKAGTVLRAWPVTAEL